VTGLPDQARDELLSRLGVHEGDTFTSETSARMNSSVRNFDEHLRVSMRLTSGKLTIAISAPVVAPDANLGANGSGVFISGPNVYNTNVPVLLSKRSPVYPPEAKLQRIQGAVKFTAMIGADGFVHDLATVSGDPLLVQAASDAVKQWQYRPALLNGEPVEAKTEITVNFTLSQ
jgi:TonB family protein